MCSQEPERVDFQEAAVDASRGAERSLSVSSTTTTGNTGQDAPPPTAGWVILAAVLFPNVKERSEVSSH